MFHVKLFNNNIDFKSFIQTSSPKINDNFGVVFVTGYQGSGKTYFAVYWLYKYAKKGKHIYTNIKSLKGFENVTYFELLDEITDNIESDCIFIIDEISKKYTKECKQDRKLYSWLQQSRKRRRQVLLITQEYVQIPVWLRGIARYVYTTHKMPLLPFFVTEKGIAQLDDETKEWYVVPEERFIYKRTKKISNLYDTMEPIPTL